MEGYPPGFVPDGESGHQAGPFLPEFAFRNLPFPPPPGFPYPRPFVPVQNQLRPVPFNAVAAPLSNGPQIWFTSEPQGFVTFPGSSGARPFGGRENVHGPWSQTGLQQSGAAFGRAAGSPGLSGGFSRPAWVEDILAQDSAAPGRSRESQSQGQSQVGGSAPGGGQGLAHNARKHGKEEEGQRGPAKRTRNGEKDGRNLQGSTRDAERGTGKAALARDVDRGSTAKIEKAVGLRSSEIDAREGRRLQPRGGRGASVKPGASEENRKGSMEERGDLKVGVRLSQQASKQDEGKEAGVPLRGPPGKPDDRRRPEGSPIGGPELKRVSSPSGVQGSRVFQLSTPLQRHRHSPAPQKSSPLADAIRQKVQLWQNAKVGATSRGGINNGCEESVSVGHVDTGHEESVHSGRREGVNSSHGGRVDTRREGGVHTNHRGGFDSNQMRGRVNDAQVVRLSSPRGGRPREWGNLFAGGGRGGRASSPIQENQGAIPTSHAQLAQRLAQIKERISMAPSPRLAAAGCHWGSSEQPPLAEPSQDPVKDFVTGIKDSFSFPFEKVTCERVPRRGDLDFNPAGGVQDNERLARVKERLSGTPPPPERTPSRGPETAEPQTPAANSRLAQIKERLSFPAAKKKPAEGDSPSSPPVLVAPQPSVFPPPQEPRPSTLQTLGSSASNKTVKVPVSLQMAAGPVSVTSGKARGVNKGPKLDVNRGTAPAGSGAGAGQSGGVNAGGVNVHQAETQKPLKDRQAWKVPEKLQKLLDQGLSRDPPPAAHPPSAQAVQALSLVHGAAKLSKKQLQRLKVQSQESKELAELQGLVGMHNVPLIMQTYWEVKGRPNAADGAASSSQPLFPIHEQLKILRQVARKSRKKLGKLRKKEALQQRQQSSGGVGKPRTGPTVAGGGSAQLEGEPGEGGGGTRKLGPGLIAPEGDSRKLGIGATRAGADLNQQGPKSSGGWGSPETPGGEPVGIGGVAEKSGVEDTAAGGIIALRGDVEADAKGTLVITSGLDARESRVRAGPGLGQSASGVLMSAEKGKASGVPVISAAMFGLGLGKTLSGDTVTPGGISRGLASVQRTVQVLEKTSVLSQAHERPSVVSGDVARRAEVGAPVMVAPRDSTTGRQVAAKPGERNNDDGVPSVNGQSGEVNGLGKGFSPPILGAEGRGGVVGQQNVVPKAGDGSGGKPLMSVTRKRKAVGGTESAALKKQAVGTSGAAGTFTELQEGTQEGGGSQWRESLTGAVVQKEPNLLEQEDEGSFQPGVLSAQSKLVLPANQGPATSAGIPGSGVEGKLAPFRFNIPPQSSIGKLGESSYSGKGGFQKHGGTGAQAPAQRSEPPAAESVQNLPFSAKPQTSLPAADLSSERRSPPAGAFSETRPLTSARLGITKAPAVDQGLLAELRAKALASQRKKAPESMVKPSETTVKVSEPTVKVSGPSVRVPGGMSRASETVDKALGTTVKASGMAKQAAAVDGRMSETAKRPSKGAEKPSEPVRQLSERSEKALETAKMPSAGVEKASETVKSLEAEKASETAAPVGASERAAESSAALAKVAPDPGVQIKPAGSTLRAPTGVSNQTEAGSQQLAAKSRAVPTLSAGQSAAATTSSPKLAPRIGVPKPAPGQTAVQANPSLVSRPLFPGALKPGLQFGSTVKLVGATNPPEVKLPQSQPGLPLNSSDPLNSTGLSAQQTLAFGRTAPVISGTLGSNLAFGSGVASKPGENSPIPSSRQVLAQSSRGSQGSQIPSDPPKAGPLGKSSPEDALAATIKALRESIQRQTQAAGPGNTGPKPTNQELPRGTEGALPGGGASQQTRRLAYIKKRKNVLVRRVTPQRGALTETSRSVLASEGGTNPSGDKGGGAVSSNRGGAPSGKTTPGWSKRQVGWRMGKQSEDKGAGARKEPVVNAVHQRKTLSWQRPSAAPGAGSAMSPHTPLLQGPGRKQGAQFVSPRRKRGLTWKLGGPVTPGGAPKVGRNSLKTLQRDPRGLGKLSAKKSNLGGLAKAGKLGGRQSAVKRRAALKWSREKGTAITPGRAGPLPVSDEKGSLLTLLRQLRSQRSYTSTYAKSTNGLSLKRTGPVGLKGNLKWTVSGGKRRKEAAEQAAQAVRQSLNNDNGDLINMSATKRKAAAAARATARSKRASLAASLRRRPGAAPPNRERVITVGLATYNMDAAGRTLVRVSEPATPGAVTLPATTPRRASVNGQTFVRQGTSDRLVIDPTSARKTLASGRLKWSLQNARRRRAARGETLCPYFTKHGRCNREGATCPFVHDNDKVAICTKFVLGRCENPDCTLTHKIIPERMPVCTYFLEGTCTNERCPFRHVSVAPDAPVCREFLQGFCPRGDTCPHKHTSVCPKFAADGQCGEGDRCGFYHPTKRTWTLARALKEAGRKRKRSRPVQPGTPPDLGEGGILLPPDDGTETEAPERPRARRRYFEADVSEVARKIKPAFLFDDV